MTSISDKFLAESSLTANYYKQVVGTYLLGRWFYKVGQPILTDKQYDALHKAFLDNEKFNHITSRHYEDDPFPQSYLKLFDVEYEPYALCEMEYQKGQTTERMSKWSTELSDEESKSIYPVESFTEAYLWIIKNIGKKLILSLKVDGINTKNLYQLHNSQYHHRVTATRSRSGSGIDVTDNMTKILPNRLTPLTDSPDILFVRGEAYVPKGSLEYLRNKYGQPYKIPRSTAISAMRTGLRDEDMHHLKVLVFKTGLGTTVEDGYLTAQELGFDTPPYVVHQFDTNDTETIEKELTDMMDKLYSISKELDIPSDGVVVQLNDLNEFNTQGDFGNYNHGAIALKYNQWAPNNYESTVKRIFIEPNKEKFSYVAEIEPVTIASGIDVSRVNIFNADIMIANDINIGQPVLFEYKSESSVNLVYKKGGQ